MAQDKRAYSLHFRVWIGATDGHFAGAGRISLLEGIRDTGSITGAAKAMKMSYRQAWQMVEDMNLRAPQPLVDKILGGKSGGGAQLTEAGIQLIRKYHEVTAAFEAFAREQDKNLNL